MRHQHEIPPYNGESGETIEMMVRLLLVNTCLLYTSSVVELVREDEVLDQSKRALRIADVEIVESVNLDRIEEGPHLLLGLLGTLTGHGDGEENPPLKLGTAHLLRDGCGIDGARDVYKRQSP